MKSQFGKLIRESDTCVLCGARPAVTKEHIPPEGLFAMKPREYLTVPACSECNHGTKLDDDYFRTVMSAGSWTEEGLRVWAEKVRPRLAERPGTRTGLRDAMTSLDLEVRPIGVQPVRVLLAKRQRLDRILEKLVSGLFWFHTGRILGVGTRVAVRGFNPLQLTEAFEDQGFVGAVQSLGVGVYEDDQAQRTFFYRAGVGNDDDSVWILVFYRQNLFVVSTGEALKPQQAPDSTDATSQHGVDPAR